MNRRSSRDWLAPLTPIYGAAVGLKNLAYDRGWLHGRRLAWPVVSVGNLSVGGAGKTPLVIRLAELLCARGVAVSVLSRGYGRVRASGRPEVVNAVGSALQFGDEPLLIARHMAAAGCDVKVVVGADRHAAGLLSERIVAERTGRTGSGIHLLDDGFQHRRLARDVDVVVLHRSDFEERLLPAGRLREPLSVLRRAGAVVIREEDTDLEAAARRLGLNAEIWWVRRSVSVSEGTQRVVAFCGIARPGEFFEGLRCAGKVLAGERAFRDHHRYSSEDVDRLRRLASEVDAAGFVTTEKDAVRLDRDLPARLTAGSWGLEVAGLAVRFRDEDRVLDRLLELVGRG